MSQKKYKKYDAQLKATILKKHLVDKIPVSNLCDEYQLAPSLFYKWQKELFDNATTVFEAPNLPKQHNHDKEKIKRLEARLAQKNEVLAELMQEHLSLKKEFGEI
jgi:transposase